MTPRRSGRGFVQFEWFILAAVLLTVLAVVLPEARKHGLMGALVALGWVAGVAAGAAGLLAAGTWMLGQGGLRRWLGAGFRFLAAGFVAAVLASALAHGHGLSATGEDRAALAAGVLGAVAGTLLHRRLGPARFWPVCRRFGLALLGSFLLGILGILGPGEWGVDMGILIPLLVFAILAASGRIVPPPEPGGNTSG